MVGVTPPGPQQIKEARQKSGLSQTEAGALIHCALRTWQDWEAGKRQMHPAMWELFCIKTEKPAAAPTDDHAAFEKHFNLSARQAWKTKAGNDYMNQEVQAKWEGWQARVAVVTATPAFHKDDLLQRVVDEYEATGDLGLTTLNMLRTAKAKTDDAS